MSGQGTFYMDEIGKAWYFSVPGKPFKISVKWWVETTVRYWNNDLGQFITVKDQGYITMKAAKFTSVTKTE